MVYVVARSDSADVGDDILHVVALFKDHGEFLTATDATSNPTLVYAYDDDDIFIDSTGTEAIEVDIAKFQSLVDHNQRDTRASIQVIAYDVDGTSIFRVRTPAS